MITRLKNRPRLDALDNQRRGAGKKLGRRIYLGSLYSIGAFFLYFFLGSFFVLDSDGLVMRDQFFVESTFPAKAIQSHVQPGQAVRKGDLLLTLQSQEVLDSIAQVSAQRADLVAKEGQLKARAASLDLLLPVAERRNTRAIANMKRIQKLSNQGLVVNGTYNDATELLYTTQREVTQLRADLSSIDEETRNLTKARQSLDDALERLRDAYGDGEVFAPADGVIGPKVATPGEVFQISETIMEILSGDTYVLMYVPTSRYYSVTEGQQVVVSDGATKMRGYVAKIGEITDALPPEFQGAFSTTERLQIVTVKFTRKPPFVIKAKVKISSTYGFNGMVEFATRMILGVDDTTTASAPDVDGSKDAIANLITQDKTPEPRDLPPLEMDTSIDLRPVFNVALPASVSAPQWRPDVQYIEPVYRDFEFATLN